MHRSSGPVAGVVGKKLVLQGRALLPFADSLLDGFAEIYVVESGSWSHLEPSIWREHWTTERAHADQPLPDDLVRALVESRAIGYASDGDGLNVVCRKAGDLERVRESLRREA